MIKFGVIGLGVGERHLRQLSRSSNVEVKWVCDLDEAKARIKAKEYRVDNFLVDWRQHSQLGDIDAVVIASYDRDHSEQVVAFIEMGIHVFVEKPLCTSQEELLTIREVYKRCSRYKPLCVSTNFILRKEARFKELQTLVQSGQLGEVYSIEASYDYGRLHKLRSGWRSNDASYSVMNGGGIHMLDLCQFITSSEFHPKFALASKVVTEGSSFIGPDFISTMGRIGRRGILKLTANFGSQTPHFHQLKVYGTKGSFINNCGDGVYYYGHEPEVVKVVDQTPFPAADKGDLLPNFLSAIEGHDQLEIGFEEIASVMETSLAIDKMALAELL